VGRHRRIVTSSRTLVGTFVLSVSALTASSSACRRAPPPPPAPATSSSKPVDRLAPGEAAPGVELAHDLHLPRGAIVEARFGTSVHVKIPLPPEQVATFVQQQATNAEAVMGPNGTIFPNLHVTGSDPGHHLRVEISTSAMGDGTQLIVDRIEERDPPPAMEPDEAMKKAGLAPNGALLDPDHIE
jgi:hypothetical protein